MTCRELVDFLMAYLDGELPAGQRASFETHLGECPACVDYLRTYVEAVKLGKEAFARSGDTVPDDVPEDLVRAVLAARKG